MKEPDTIETILPEIKQWKQAVDTLADQRQSDNCTLLLEKRSLESLDEKISAESEPIKITEIYLLSFYELCLEVSKNASLTAVSLAPPIVERIYYISELVYLLDWGLEISYTLIRMANYPTDELLKKKLIFQDFNTLVDILLAKRSTLINYRDLFSSQEQAPQSPSPLVNSTQDLTPTSNLVEAYGLISFLGLEDKLSFASFEKEINALTTSQNLPASKMEISNWIKNYLEINHKLFTFPQDSTPEEALEIIKQAIPELKYEVINKKEIGRGERSSGGASHINYDLELEVDGEKLTLPFATDLAGSFVKSINPLLAKHFSKIFLYLDYGLNDTGPAKFSVSFLLISPSFEKLIKSNKFFFPEQTSANNALEQTGLPSLSQALPTTDQN